VASVLGRPTLKDSALYRARSFGSPGIRAQGNRVLLAGFGRDGGARLERQQRHWRPHHVYGIAGSGIKRAKPGTKVPEGRRFSSSLSADATLLFRPGGTARGGSGSTGGGSGCLRAACISVDFKASQPPHIARRS
jgi:hypothetical protein